MSKANEAATYTVNNEPFNSFKEAVARADKLKADVIEVATGVRRWTPAPSVSSKKLKMYRERQAAFEAQEAARKN